MASLSGEKTLAELSAEFGVHPTMISNWKQELVKRAGELFARGSKAPAVGDAQKVIDDLHGLSFAERRARLERWYAREPRPSLDLSPMVPFTSWEGLRELRDGAREHDIEGLMLKRAD